MEYGYVFSFPSFLHFFGYMVLICSPGWPKAHDPPAFWMLGSDKKDFITTLVYHTVISLHWKTFPYLFWTEVGKLLLVKFRFMDQQAELKFLYLSNEKENKLPQIFYWWNLRYINIWIQYKSTSGKNLISLRGYFFM